MSDAMDLLAKAEGYLRSARGGLTRPEIFSAEIAHNILTMGMENIAGGILAHIGVALPHFSLATASKFLTAELSDQLPLAVMQRLAAAPEACGNQPVAGAAPKITREELPVLLEQASELLGAARLFCQS